MAVLKAVVDDHSKDLDRWLTGEQRGKLLNVLRDSFLFDANENHAKLQRRKDILYLIELFVSSFQLTDAARQFYFNGSV